MKIRIEIDNGLSEDEIIIRARNLSPDIHRIQQAVSDALTSTQKFTFYKEETAYYLPIEEILFFETEGGNVFAHTGKNIYETRHRLYELEELLPGFFMRVSKSTILNTRRIHSITKTLPSSCIAQFQGTHKQVYISRYYYKPLKERLEEKR